MSSGGAFPRINLASFAATDLVVAGAYEPTDERVELVKSASGSASTSIGHYFGSVSTYLPRSGKVRPRHYLTGSLIVEDSDRTEVRFAMRYSTFHPLGSAPMPRGMADESGFLDLIGRLGDPRSIWASVDFVFRDPAADDLWFPLPTQIAGDLQAEAVYEVRGVRGARLANPTAQDSEFVFTLDRPTGKDVFLDVRFDLAGRLTPRLPREVIERASKIAQGLVALGGG